jgi:hypothetical protein
MVRNHRPFILSLAYRHLDQYSGSIVFSFGTRSVQMAWVTRKGGLAWVCRS